MFVHGTVLEDSQETVAVVASRLWTLVQAIIASHLDYSSDLITGLLAPTLTPHSSFTTQQQDLII